MKLLLLTLCLTVTLLEVSSYQCYSCAAQLGTGDACEIDLQKAPKCEPRANCGAYVTKNTNNVRILTRGCFIENICDLVMARPGHEGEILETCDTCQSELCNKDSYTDSKGGSTSGSNNGSNNGSQDSNKDGSNDDSSSAVLLPSMILSCVLLVLLRLYH